jgi:hypothetical protein
MPFNSEPYRAEIAVLREGAEQSEAEAALLILSLRQAIVEAVRLRSLTTAQVNSVAPLFGWPSYHGPELTIHRFGAPSPQAPLAGR